MGESFGNINIVVLIGDSMLNGLDEKGFINHKVNIKAHSGATSDDITHYIKPIINKSPDVIILHCGTNDIVGWRLGYISVDNSKRKSMTTLVPRAPGYKICYF